MSVEVRCKFEIRIAKCAMIFIVSGWLLCGSSSRSGSGFGVLVRLVVLGERRVIFECVVANNTVIVLGCLVFEMLTHKSSKIFMERIHDLLRNTLAPDTHSR